MPIEKYFGGHGKEVMAKMKKKHGKRAVEVFHRTANKRGQNPGKKKDNPYRKMRSHTSY